MTGHNFYDVYVIQIWSVNSIIPVINDYGQKRLLSCIQYLSHSSTVYTYYWKVGSSLSGQTVITVPLPIPGTAQPHGQPGGTEKCSRVTNSQHFCNKCLHVALRPFSATRIKFKHNLKHTTNFKTNQIHPWAETKEQKFLTFWMVFEISKAFLQGSKQSIVFPIPKKTWLLLPGFLPPTTSPDFMTM